MDESTLHFSSSSSRFFFFIIIIVIIDLTRQTDVPDLSRSFLLQPPIRSFSTRINVPS